MKYWITLLGLVLTFGKVYAQTEFDPSQIFTDSVIFEELPVTSFEVDNTTRLLRYNGRDYPFPSEIISMSTFNIQEVDAGFLFRVSASNDPDPNTYTVHNYRLFDPLTGIFILPESICGDVPRAGTGEGQWVFYDDDGRFFTCFTEDGSLHGPFDVPEHLQAISVSPEGDWLFLIQRQQEQNSCNTNITYFGLNVETDELNELGQELDLSRCSNSYPSSFRGWVSDTRVILINSAPQSWQSGSIITYDVSIENSGEYIRTWDYQLSENPLRFENSLSHDYIEGQLGIEISEHQPCTFRVIDSLGLDTYELGNDCSYEYDIYGINQPLNPLRLASGDYLFLRANKNSEVSTIVRIDRGTDQFTEIWSGDIMQLLDVSPDERFIVFAQYSDYTLRILDTINYTFVFIIPYRGYADMEWLSADNVLITAGVRLDSGIVPHINVSPDGGVIYDGTGSDTTYYLNLADGSFSGVQVVAQLLSSTEPVAIVEGEWLDFRTMERIPIIRPEVLGRYYLEYEWNIENQLIVTVSESSTTLQGHQYRIRVPGR